MKTAIRDTYQNRASVLKAVAHPVRMFIIEALAHKDRCVRELTEAVELDISTVSKHLAVLKHAGIVADSRQGVQVFYTLKCRCATHFFSCVDEVLEAAGTR